MLIWISISCIKGKNILDTNLADFKLSKLFHQHSIKHCPPIPHAPHSEFNSWPDHLKVMQGDDLNEETLSDHWTVISEPPISQGDIEKENEANELHLQGQAYSCPESQTWSQHHTSIVGSSQSGVQTWQFRQQRAEKKHLIFVSVKRTQRICKQMDNKAS